jgi:hypothetical protein
MRGRVIISRNFFVFFSSIATGDVLSLTAPCLYASPRTIIQYPIAPIFLCDLLHITTFPSTSRTPLKLVFFFPSYSLLIFPFAYAGVAFLFQLICFHVWFAFFMPLSITVSLSLKQNSPLSLLILLRNSHLTHPTYYLQRLLLIPKF